MAVKTLSTGYGEARFNWTAFEVIYLFFFFLMALLDPELNRRVNHNENLNR